MKSYTDLEQSKKLAEILPLESADMWWSWYSNPVSNGHYDDFPMFCKPVCNPDESVPCWSLASLLGVLPFWYDIHPVKNGVALKCDYGKEEIVISNNPIDACVNMIEKLRELNLLLL